jgi:hypothetical protein
MEQEGIEGKRIGNYIPGKGRPNIFDYNNITPEQLEQMVNEYFDSGANEKTYYPTINGKVIEKTAKLYTFTGLILYLGFISRDTFFEWEKKRDEASKPYSDILKTARTRIEQYYEELCQTNNPVGSIFILKNLGYSDQQTINQTVAEIKPPEVITQDKETAKDTKQLIKLMKDTNSN